MTRVLRVCRNIYRANLSRKISLSLDGAPALIDFLDSRSASSISARKLVNYSSNGIKKRLKKSAVSSRWGGSNTLETLPAGESNESRSWKALEQKLRFKRLAGVDPRTRHFERIVKFIFARARLERRPRFQIYNNRASRPGFTGARIKITLRNILGGNPKKDIPKGGYSRAGSGDAAVDRAVESQRADQVPERR